LWCTCFEQVSWLECVGFGHALTLQEQHILVYFPGFLPRQIVGNTNFMSIDFLEILKFSKTNLYKINWLKKIYSREAQKEKLN
jgi:hypothetical protein